MRVWLLALFVMGCTPMAAESSSEPEEATPQTQTVAVDALAEPEPSIEIDEVPVKALVEKHPQHTNDVAAIEVTDDAAFLPADVQAFIDDRENCEHFMGEFVGDPSIDEPRGINQKIEEACEGLDERLRLLNRLYRSHEGVKAALSEYEPLY